MSYIRILYRAARTLWLYPTISASWRWAIRATLTLFLGLCASNVLLPAIARAQFAASARMSVVDILAALVGQNISANSYTATASSGSGLSCSSQLESCIDLGPGSCNYIGTDSGGRVRIGASCAPEVWIGDGTTRMQPGNVQILNGALFLNNTYVQNLSGGSVLIDNTAGFQLTPKVATPACAGANAGTFSALSSTGAPFYCNGTAAQQIVTKASWSSSLDFAAMGGVTCQTITFAAMGAIKDEPVVIGGCGSVVAGDIGLTCMGAVSANDVASIRVCCSEALGCANLPAITFSLTAIR